MLIAIGILVFLLLVLVLPSIRVIGPTEVGLVTKRFSVKKLTSENPIAFRGEAGYQAILLMPGWRFKFWIIYSVTNYPWVQVPAGEIGVVVSQVGKPLPVGAKSAEYKKEFGDFSRLDVFIRGDGQKGVQRPVLSPGTLAPIHPVGFLTITRTKVFGRPISPELLKLYHKKGGLTPEDFGLDPDKLYVTVIGPESTGRETREVRDTVGIITTYEGDPLPPGDIASRLGGFEDLVKLEAGEASEDSVLVEAIIGAKNSEHNNYQDFQAFLDAGGRIGLQHDPLLYGAFNLNPFLVSVDIVPMLVVEQGEVAVIKAYVGQVTRDTSGETFKYGSLVRPGHRGIWRESLRTGKYPINPHCYQSEIVPTAIVTLNWATAVSEAHHLDEQLSQIIAKSREGFIFSIDLQVLIHVPDVKASRVISMVGTMKNLVNEVLQSAVGNHFRDKLQSLPAVNFIETRQQVQEEAYAFIRDKLQEYDVETLGVYIQDVIFPDQLVVVLTNREIAHQEIATYKKQEEAQTQRIAMEQQTGVANQQADLAEARVSVEIKEKKAEARKAEADGEAEFISQTGRAKAAEVLAVGIAKAEGYERQVAAIGKENTAMVNVVGNLGDNKIEIVPKVMVSGEGGGAVGGIMGMFMQKLLRESGEEKKSKDKK